MDELKQQLASRIDPQTGMSSAVSSRYISAQVAMRGKRTKYFGSKLVLDEIDLILEDSELDQGNDNTSISSNVARLCKETMLQTKMHNLRLLDPASMRDAIKVFQLNDSDVQSRSAEEKLLLQQNIIPLLETRLKNKCEKLLQFFYDDSASSSSQSIHGGVGRRGELSYAKALQLRALVSRDQDKIRALKQKLQSLNAHLYTGPECQEYLTLLSEMVSHLELMIVRHKLESKSHFVDVTVNWLDVKCKATCMKLRQMILQVLKDTYTSDNIAALRKIKSQIESDHNRLLQDYNNLHHTLQMYESMGDTFKAIAEEYSHVLEEISTNRWALQELTGNDH
eukprot:m.12575 g.12575  ORF g.12575 m.12575 type:complete len:338 (-) comp9369_c0_seq1:336-1349(-)